MSKLNECTGTLGEQRSQMTTISVRPALPDDAAAIAELHVRSWQWAYRGQIPDDYLNGLTAELPERTARRQEYLTFPRPDHRTWVVERDGQVVGFAQTGPSNDPDSQADTADSTRFTSIRTSSELDVGERFLPGPSTSYTRRAFGQRLSGCSRRMDWRVVSTRQLGGVQMAGRRPRTCGASHLPRYATGSPSSLLLKNLAAQKSGWLENETDRPPS
jgi:hypothetical protein